VSGIALSRRFYADAVRPLLGGRRHAAALLGEGSEVLGFDDGVSTDHDFGPRVQVFLPAGVAPPSWADLPRVFEGHPTVFATTGGEPSHQVEVTTAGAFFARRDFSRRSLPAWVVSGRGGRPDGSFATTST